MADRGTGVDEDGDSSMSEPPTPDTEFGMESGGDAGRTPTAEDMDTQRLTKRLREEDLLHDRPVKTAAVTSPSGSAAVPMAVVVSPPADRGEGEAAGPGREAADSYFDWIPHDVTAHILSFLGRDVCIAWWVCRTWRELCMDPYVWDRIVSHTESQITAPDVLDWALVPEPHRRRLVNSSSFIQLVGGPPFLNDMDWEGYSRDRFQSKNASSIFSIIQETQDLRALGRDLLTSWRMYWDIEGVELNRDLREGGRLTWATSLRSARVENLNPDLATNYSAQLFIAKVLYLVAVRVHALCEVMCLPKFIHEQVFATVTHAIKEKIGLLKHRNVDHLILCSVYILCKANQLPCHFRTIIDDFRELPMARTETYRKVSLVNAHGGDSGDEAEGDIIRFYNTVFLSAMRSFVIELRSSETRRQHNDFRIQSAHELVRDFQRHMTLPIFIVNQVEAACAHIVSHKPELLEHRHMDQLVMCTLYAVLKINSDHQEASLDKVSFSAIIQAHSQLRGNNQDMYRAVRVGPTNKNIIDFYNDVYLVEMREFVLGLKLWPQDREPGGPALRGRRGPPVI